MHCCRVMYVSWWQLSKMHRNGHLPIVDWLDRLTFREIEIINERLKQHSNFLYLMIEFPCFQCNNTEYSVFYFEKVFKNVIVIITFGLHRLHAVYRYSLSLRVSHVAWSVCLCVCVEHTVGLCKNSWTNRDAIWQQTHVSPRNQCFFSRAFHFSHSFYIVD